MVQIMYFYSGLYSSNCKSQNSQMLLGVSIIRECRHQSRTRSFLLLPESNTAVKLTWGQPAVWAPSLKLLPSCCGFNKRLSVLRKEEIEKQRGLFYTSSMAHYVHSVCFLLKKQLHRSFYSNMFYKRCVKMLPGLIHREVGHLWVSQESNRIINITQTEAGSWPWAFYHHSLHHSSPVCCLQRAALPN